MVDVAQYLGVSHQRIAQMVAEGKLPASRRDRLGPYWTPSAIERWAERKWWGTKPWRVQPGAVRHRLRPCTNPCTNLSRMSERRASSARTKPQVTVRIGTQRNATLRIMSPLLLPTELPPHMAYYLR
jgi:hypothetical protein